MSLQIRPKLKSRTLVEMVFTKVSEAAMVSDRPVPLGQASLTAIAVLFAFLAGGVILNVLKEELLKSARADFRCLPWVRVSTHST